MQSKVNNNVFKKFMRGGTGIMKYLDLSKGPETTQLEISEWFCWHYMACGC